MPSTRAAVEQARLGLVAFDIYQRRIGVIKQVAAGELDVLFLIGDTAGSGQVRKLHPAGGHILKFGVDVSGGNRDLRTGFAGVDGEVIDDKAATGVVCGKSVGIEIVSESLEIAHDGVALSSQTEFAGFRFLFLRRCYFGIVDGNKAGAGCQQLVAVTIVLKFRAFQFAEAENFFTGHFGGRELDDAAFSDDLFDALRPGKRLIFLFTGQSHGNFLAERMCLRKPLVSGWKAVHKQSPSRVIVLSARL